VLQTSLKPGYGVLFSKQLESNRDQDWA